MNRKHKLIHLQTLHMGRPIVRAHYNHDSGLFDQPNIVHPHSIIINEGLHAFYSDVSAELSDFRIFVDACEQLRTHWKIQRDTTQRGYSKEEVLEAIQLRKKDSDQLRKNQMEKADLIIKIGTVVPIKEVGFDKITPLKVDFDLKNNKMTSLVTYLYNNLK